MFRQSYFPAASAAYALALACAGACTIDVPALADGGDGLPADCSRYADQLVSFTPPDAEEGTGEGGERALGEPDGDGVPLDRDGVLVVAFIGASGIEDGEGDDLTLHASGDEEAEITAYVSESEGGFVFAGEVTPDETGIDLATARARRAVYLRLVGTAGTMTVDAVEATRDVCGELSAHRSAVPSSRPRWQKR